MAPRPDLTELGTTGLRRSSGYVYEEFLTQLRGRLGTRTYREMADNDPVIGSFLFAIEKIITRLEWRVDPYTEAGSMDDPAEQDIEVAQFVEGCLNDMSDSWDSTLASILSFVVFGWSWHEIVYKIRGGPDQKDPKRRSKYSDGKVGWRKWPIRAQETWMRWVFDEDGGIQAYVQYDPSGGGMHEIPVEKSLLFRTTAQKNNPEGRSLLRNAYRPWYFKRRIEEIEAIGIERDLAGLPVAMVPPEYLSSGATPDQTAVLNAVKEIVTSIKRNENEGVIFPVIYDDAGHKLFDLTLLSSGGSRQFDTDKVITRYDQRIAMSVLSDFILLGHDRVGSFALGASKIDLWTMAVDSLCKTIADTINTHAIPRLLRLNGMDVSRPPRLAYSEVAHVDLAEISDFVSKMTAAGIIAPDPLLEDHLREIAGLPPANHTAEAAGGSGVTPEDQQALLAPPGPVPGPPEPPAAPGDAVAKHGDHNQKDHAGKGGAPHSLGIDRGDMPQVPKTHRDKFLAELRAEGISVRDEVVEASSLQQTQQAMIPESVSRIADAMRSGTYRDSGHNPVVSSDDHILDGHHRWAAAREVGLPVSITRVDMPIERLVERARAFNEAEGIAARTMQG